MRRIEFDPGQTEEEARAEQRRQIQKLRPVYNKVFVQPDTEMSQPYRHKETSVFLLDYHIIFCPKRRRPVLEGALKVRLEEVIRNVASEIDAEVLALQIMPDHVHLFVSGVPQMAPNQIAGRFKGASSRILRQEFPHLLRLPSLWTRSTFISTAGNVSSGTIQKYIEAQSKR